MDLNTLTMSQRRLILVLTSAESSFCINYLADSYKDKGFYEKTKSLRKRDDKLSKDFYFLPEGTSKSGPFYRMMFIVLMAYLRPRQTQLFFAAFLTTSRLQKMLTISQILRLSTFSWIVTLSSSSTIPSLPSKFEINFLLSSSRLFSLRLQESIFCLMSSWWMSSWLMVWGVFRTVKMGFCRAMSCWMIWVSQSSIREC